MKFHLITLLIFLITFQVNSQDRIQVNIPSAKTEAAYIWRTIQDTKFFEEHNYQVNLPKGKLIETLKQKAKTGSLSNEDYEGLERYVIDSVYQKADYQQGYEMIKAKLALINKMVNQINQSNYDWEFKVYNTYAVNLTLYGPGGSYNPDEGSILIYTTTKGQFKSYDNPANTIIHEIIHIGIEKSIIGKYNVPHAMKERIVDTFVSLNFSDDLPDYRIQEMGDTRIDPFLKKITDLRMLDTSVEKILSDQGRR